MGQENLWSGNLESGSLSDKQKEILKKKKEVTNQKEAYLLGSGFFKYTGIDKTAYSDEEAIFWDERSAGKSVSTGSYSLKAAQTNVDPDASSSPDTYQPKKTFSPAKTGVYQVNVGNSRMLEIPEDVAAYYLKTHDNDAQALAASLNNRGAKRFIEMYKQAMIQDPEGRGNAGGSVV